MARTGNIFPTVGANVDRAGSTAWTNPGNVVSDNATDATVVVPSDYLVTSSYGFTVPTDATIHGVIVRVEAGESGTGTTNYVPQLHSATTPTLIGAAKSAVTVSGATKVISTNGAINDLWSATLTPAIVNAAGFGVSIWSADTINTLAVDFITIEIIFSQPAAFVPVRALKRLNKTNRRARFALLNPQENGLPPSEPASDDRALEGGFVTVSIRSRRSLSVGWIAALAAQVVSEVPPVAAWLVVPVRRRRETERRLLLAESTPIERYTPPSIAWSDPPQVIRVDFRRTLQALAVQVELPPTVAPPTAQGFPAWATVPLPPTLQDRRLLVAPAHEVYPETPKPEPEFCARIPGGFHKRTETKRRLLTVYLDEFTATPASEISDDRALEAAFVTRKIRSRRLIKTPELLAVAPATPGTSEAPLPAWAEQRATYRPSHRTLRRELELNSYPATPAVEQPTVAAFEQRKAKRRKHRQGLFMSAGGVVEARVQPQFPSYAVPPPKKRKSHKRRLLRAPGLPSSPQTPTVPAQPQSAWRAPVQHRIERERRIQPAAAQITYPATPAVAAQPETAWRAARANRVEHTRTLQKAAPQLLHPPTPVIPVSEVAAIAVEALPRRGIRRRLHVAPHGPSYPATPAPPQPVTALVLGGFHRRHGWRAPLVVLELDERPETPPPAPVTRTGRRIKAGAQGRRGQASLERIVQAKRRNRKIDVE